jgi:3(or 17)beta-hydroxysteroid dehydrogenase
MGRLNDRVALVTGGASGLGKVIGQRLQADGARVVITDTNAELGQATAAQYGFVFIQQDVCSEGQWPSVVRDAESNYGAISILVNNAGISGPVDAGDPEKTQIADWRKVFAVNVEAVLLGCRAVMAGMGRNGGGSIINMSSMAGLRASPYAVAYGASKAAVRQLTKSIAQHCAQQRLNIRCNSVHPGIVRTQLWESYAQEVARTRGISVNDFVNETAARIPLGDLTLPEDVAATVAFLASDDSRHITGAEILVDGGMVNCETFRVSS